MIWQISREIIKYLRSLNRLSKLNRLEEKATEYKVPRVVFCNKMEAEGANYDRVLKRMQNRLKSAEKKSKKS